MAKEQTYDVAFLPAVATDLVLGKRQIPSPGPGEVLIRNHAIAVNPVDWKRQSRGFVISSYPVVLGAGKSMAMLVKTSFLAGKLVSNISGIVSEVGALVTEFKPGDRVLAIAHSFVSGNNDNGAFQNYTIVNATATTALPHEMSFQQGVTLPTAVGTGALALFDVLDLPRPTVGTVKNLSESSSPVILVWGGASTTGSLTIQLARLAGLTVYTTASERHHNYLRSLGASVLVDYHSPTVVDDLLAAAELAGTQINYAVDAISTAETLASVLQILSKSTKATKKLAHTLPWPENIPTPDGIETGAIRGDALADRRQDLCAWLFNDTLPKWLERGDIVPTAYRVIDGGLGGLQNALNELRKGVSGEKLVVEV